MTTENKPRTLEELIAKHHGETVEYSNAELIASLIEWGRAERRAERERCAMSCEKEAATLKAFIKKQSSHCLQVEDQGHTGTQIACLQAQAARLRALPDIEGDA
jgi:hypothetical protein